MGNVNQISNHHFLPSGIPSNDAARLFPSQDDGRSDGTTLGGCRSRGRSIRYHPLFGRGASADSGPQKRQIPLVQDEHLRTVSGICNAIFFNYGAFQYLFAIITSWLFCVVLTVFNLVSKDSAARVDRNTSVEVIRHSNWVEVPYPGNEIIFFEN